MNSRTSKSNFKNRRPSQVRRRKHGYLWLHVLIALGDHKLTFCMKNVLPICFRALRRSHRCIPLRNSDTAFQRDLRRWRSPLLHLSLPMSITVDEIKETEMLIKIITFHDFLTSFAVAIFSKFLLFPARKVLIGERFRKIIFNDYQKANKDKRSLVMRGNTVYRVQGFVNQKKFASIKIFSLV